MNRTYFVIIFTFLTAAFVSAQTVDAELLQQIRHGETADVITRTDITGTPNEGSLFFDAATEKVYIYRNATWVELLDQASGWQLAGNVGTDDTTDFIGTTDGQDLVLKTNGNEELRIASVNGQLLINEAPVFNGHPLVIRANGNDVIAFQDSAGNPDWHWNLLGNGLNFVESGVADFRVFLENGGNVGINTNNPEATVDINPVSNEVPLRVRPSASTPAGANSGEFHVAADGLLYTYDTSRNKWLSVDRQFVGWGRSSNSAANSTGSPPSTGEYLRQFNGALSSNNGWRMIRNGTITAITVQSNNVDTFDIQIRKNDDPAAIATLSVVNAEGAHVTNINVDFTEGEFLQCFLPAIPGGVASPEVLIEIAWRQ